MINKQYENLIEFAKEVSDKIKLTALSYLYEKYGAAFLQLNAKQQNIMICETLRRAIKEKISLKDTHGV